MRPGGAPAPSVGRRRSGGNKCRQAPKGDDANRKTGPAALLSASRARALKAAPAPGAHGGRVLYSRFRSRSGPAPAVRAGATALTLSPTTRRAERGTMAETFKFEAEVAQVVLETMDVLTFRFEIPKDVPFRFRAGQFINLTVDTPEYGPEMARLTRAYSISSSPTEGDFIDLTIKYYEDGHVSKHMREVTYVGEPMTIEGPFGHFYFEKGTADAIALIGGGAGVAPMRGIARWILDEGLPVEIRYLASCRTPKDMIYLATLMQWTETHPNLHVQHTVTRPEGQHWNGPTGRIDADRIRQFCPPETTGLYYLAGPTEMVKGVRRILKEDLGVDKKRVIWEPWG
jgi:ferredoxin-NADP reductase